MPSTTSTPFVHWSCWVQTPLHIPCKFSDCRCWFSNKSGLTQHFNQFHPDFLAFDPTSVTPSSGPIPIDQDDAPNEPGEPWADDDGHPPHAGEEREDASSQWHGHNAKLYRNYHTTLTSML